MSGIDDTHLPCAGEAECLLLGDISDREIIKKIPRAMIPIFDSTSVLFFRDL